nr:MFS transporter [Streptomyces scabichelini]
MAKDVPATAPPPTPAPPEAATVQLGPRRVRLVFGALMLALLLAALEQMIVATALPKIVGELHGLDRMSWAITAYLLMATVTLPVHGKFGDLYGRKGAFQFAIVVFVVGSALAGRSRTMDQLIAFRALQGIGAGGLLIGVQAILTDIVPAGKRGRFMGLTGAAFGLASVAGPLLGGYVTDHLSWRWCFYLNVPFGLVTSAVVALALVLPKPTAKPRLDVLGALLLAVASTCLVLLVSWGGTEYAWNSRVILGLGAGAVAATVLFLFAERFAADPLIPLRLFRDGDFNVTAIVGLITGVALFGAAGYLPTYLQTADGATATEAGLLMLPLTAGIVGASVVSGQLIGRTGHYRTYPVLGGGLSVIGMWLLSRLDADTPRLHCGIWAAVLGGGIGLVMPVLVLAVQNSVRPHDIGAATSAHTFFRQIGGCIGAALLGRLFADRLTGIPAYAETMPRTFLHLVPLLVLGLLIAFFLKGKPLVPDHIPAVDQENVNVLIPQALCASYAAGVPVHGTVRLLDGTFVPQAALTLIDISGQQIGRGVSGEDGRYELATPGWGAYVLIATAGGHQPQAVRITVGERSEMGVPPPGGWGRPVELDVVLGAAGRLAGRVVTAGGAPVHNATVTLTDVHGQVVATTRSGREGGYVVTEVEAGEYTLAASAPALRPAALPVTVRAARESRQDVELTGGSVLRGTVRAGAGRPVEDARVTLLDAAGNVVGTWTTSGDGVFRFVDLPSGEYTVIAAGYPPVAGVLQVAGGGRTEHDLQLGH